MDFLSITKEIHWKSLKFQNFPIFSRFWNFRDTFLRDEKIIFFREHIFLIQKLLRNPKITLRKPCDHFKYAKNKKELFFCIDHQIGILSRFNLVIPLYRDSASPHLPLGVAGSMEGRTPPPVFFRAFAQVLKHLSELKKVFKINLKKINGFSKSL